MSSVPPAIASRASLTVRREPLAPSSTLLLSGMASLRPDLL
ncbi:hypothetical protein WME90_38775 [Sorangium sp. So ce375]